MVPFDNLKAACIDSSLSDSRWDNFVLFFSGAGAIRKMGFPSIKVKISANKIGFRVCNLYCLKAPYTESQWREWVDNVSTTCARDERVRWTCASGCEIHCARARADGERWAVCRPAHHDQASQPCEGLAAQLFWQYSGSPTNPMVLLMTFLHSSVSVLRSAVVIVHKCLTLITEDSSCKFKSKTTS